MEKDLVVIGGGPGGYVAAIRGAQLGANVTLIEERNLGGTCLNRGCIPTKALYTNAEIIGTLKRIDEFGLTISDYQIDIDKIHERKQKVVDQLVGGIGSLLKAYDVEVVEGSGTLVEKNTVRACLHDGTEREIKTKNVIIATGSKPALPPIPGVELEGVFTSDEMLNFKDIPKKLLIVGGGVIGMEFAGIFNALGSEINIVDIAPSILERVDKDITKRLTPMVKKEGIALHLSAKVAGIEKSDAGLVVTIDGKKGEMKEEVDRILVSSGRIPIVEGINLDGVGIEYDRRGIKTDENCQTNIEGIYAIGDVTGGMMLAHVASHDGLRAAEHMMGIESSASHDVVPSCIFVHPQIATVGLTEQEAKEKELDYKVSKFTFGANGKALAMGEGEGFVKVISTGADYQIIGVHIMGPHASDLIHEGALAITHKMNVDDIAHTIHAHPTLGEAFSEAVLGLKGEAIHMAPPRKSSRKR